MQQKNLKSSGKDVTYFLCDYDHFFDCLSFNERVGILGRSPNVENNGCKVRSLESIPSVDSKSNIESYGHLGSKPS